MSRFKKLTAMFLAILMIVPFASSFSIFAETDTADDSSQWYVNAEYDDNTALISTGNFTLDDNSDTPSISNLIDMGLAEKETVVNGTTMYKITDVQDFLSKYMGYVSAGGASKLTIEAEDYLNEVVRVVVFFDEPTLFENSELNLGVGKKTDSELYTACAETAKSVQDKHIAEIEKVDSSINFVSRGVLLANYATFEMPRKLMDKLRNIKGVQKVTLEPTYTVAPYDLIDDGEGHSGDSTGAFQIGLEGAWRNGFTGEGMAIAIIDTGCQYTHQGFDILPDEETIRYNTDAINALLSSEQFQASERIGGELTADDVYINAKFPFVFDYASNDTDVLHHGINQHGTSVAGVIGAHTDAPDTFSFCQDKIGVAPDAQLVIMKVFEGDGAYMSDIVAAMEDSILLGVDAVNLSLGHACGFDNEYDWTEVFDRAVEAGISVVCSAGNEYNSMSGVTDTGYPYTSNPDNGTIGGPGTYSSSLTVGSLNSADVAKPDCFFYFDNEKLSLLEFTEPYMMWIDWEFGEDPCFFNKVFNGSTEPFVICWNNDVSTYDLTGKIAFMFEDEDGNLTNQDVYETAVKAGATGVIIVPWSEDDDCLWDYDIVTNDTVPCSATYWLDFYDYLWWYIEECGITEDEYYITTPSWSETTTNAGEMSDFSSWGPTPDLKIKPEVLGIGGNVYSLYGEEGSNAYYVWISGTSFSAPQVAAASTLVRQYVEELYPTMNATEVAALTNKILMSTAVPVVDPDTGYFYSPRQQGAGLIDLTAATSTTTYLEVNGNRPKIELGDDPEKTGVYELTFSIVNIGDTEKVYTIDTTVFTEQAEGVGYVDGEYRYSMTGEEHMLDPDISGVSEVTIPAGETVEVTITVSLTALDKHYFTRYYSNGGSVEGYVILTEQNSALQNTLTLPFLGFYGDWTAVPVFDDVYYYDHLDDLDAGDELTAMGMMGAYTTVNGELVGLGDINFGIESTYHISSEDYTDMYNYISPNGDGIRDGLEYVVLPLMRNVEKLTYSITDNDTGEVYYYDYAELLTKSRGLPQGIHDEENDSTFWFMPWYGTDADGNALPDGTSVTVSIVAEKYYNGELITDNLNSEWHFNLTIDTVAPELVSYGPRFEEPRYSNGHIINEVKIEVRDEGRIGYWMGCGTCGGPYWPEYGSGEKFWNYMNESVWKGYTPGEISASWSQLGTAYRNTYSNMAYIAMDFAGNISIWAYTDGTNPQLDVFSDYSVNTVQFDCAKDVYLRVGDTLDISNLIDIEEYGIVLTSAEYDYIWGSTNETAVSVSGNLDSATITANAVGEATVSLRLRSLPAYDYVTVHVIGDENVITKNVIGNGRIEGPDSVETFADAEYTFVADEGWHIKDVIIDNVSVGAVESYTFTNVISSHSVTVEFEINTYTVTFIDGFNGSIISTATATHGSAVTTPELPIHDDYEFNGWTGGNIDCITSDCFIVATYVESGSTPAVYTVYFVDWDGTVISEQQVTSGNAAVAPEDPSREKYTFTGWAGGDYTNVTENMVLVAQYELNYTLGDVNYDGTINTIDALMALRAAMSIDTLEDESIIAADINENLVIEVADALAILRMAMELA